MRKILLVDDDPNGIQEFKNMFQSTRSEWSIEYAKSGKEALDILNESPFDVVVSDMRMPQMDGVELLGIVTEQYPETVRIILSELSDQEMALKSVKSSHQFLTKPYDMKAIRYSIERACKLQDLLKNGALKRIVTGIKDLPSFPTLYGLIVKEMQSPDPSLKKVGYIIAQDVSMSAKILKVVNSAYFGLPREITDPQQAVVYIGTETLKALVISVHVFSSFAEEAEFYGVSLENMQKHSLMVSRLARDIARAELAERKVAEETFVAGILHDIGRLVLLKAPYQYRQVKSYIENNGSDSVEAEYAVLKTSHAELGAYLLGLWVIPDSIVETAAFHHNPSKLLEDVFETSVESPDNVGDKSKSDNNYMADFNVLTSVHVASSLITQEKVSSNTSSFPYVYMQYLKTLKLANKLPRWADCCYKIKQEQA